MMIVVVLLSTVLISVKAHHECEGEECTVCECIEMCIGILTRFGAKLSASASHSVQRAVFVPALAVFALVLTAGSPVSRKERLNN